MTSSWRVLTSGLVIAVAVGMLLLYVPSSVVKIERFPVDDGSPGSTGTRNNNSGLTIASNTSTEDESSVEATTDPPSEVANSDINVSQVTMLTEGSLSESRLPILPERTGPCQCVVPFTNNGGWADGNWVPHENDRNGFVTPDELLASITGYRHGKDKVRFLFVGDSIARYLTCFLSKAIAEHYPLLNGTGCEPEQTRGVLYQLWPPTEELQRKSPFILHFVSDFYFPESHVTHDAMSLFESENPWLPPVKVIVVSRGTWDTWIRLPRPLVGRQLLNNYARGIEYMRVMYPTAAISVYALSKQYPSRYHRHSERCAMTTSSMQVRALVYCATRLANAMLAERGLLPVQLFDMFAMTWADTLWHFNTMNNDGMHFIGPHVPWFAKYLLRLVSRQLRNDSTLATFTPPPLSSECDEKRLPLNTMPPQKKLRQPKNLWKNPKKERRDCGIWLREKIQFLNFDSTRSLNRFEGDGQRMAECMTYHKSSTQRFGGLDPQWPSPFTEAIPESSPLFNVSLVVKKWVSTHLWGLFSQQSSNCARLQASFDARGVQELRRLIDNSTSPCSLLVVLTMRSTPEVRKKLQMPNLRDQRCDMLRKAPL